MQIKRAQLEDLDAITPLFDAYRVFYKQASNKNAAHDFIKSRLKNKQSIILIAQDENQNPIGFTQLYPSYSSVALKQVFILNDLFVAKEGRNTGVGAALLDAAKDIARKNGARGLVLETDRDNPAQKLYEKNGWTKDRSLHYYWEV